MSTATATTVTAAPVTSIPDTPSMQKKSLRKVPKTLSINEIIDIVHEDGAVVIENFLSESILHRFNNDVEPHMTNTVAGSTHTDEFVSAFHGNNTKRLTNLVSLSPTFRKEVLDDDFTHSIASQVFTGESGSYWMTTAQVIEIGPGNTAQMLHRDLENSIPYIAMGPTGPEAMINFLVGLTDFTAANGATRIIPSSNHWPDYNDRGHPDMTIPAEIKAGDAILLSGKTVHGGGHNQTVNEWRRGLAFTFQPSFLTPEEAFPFLVDLELVKTMSERAQRMIGFRSQYPKGSPGLWQVDYKEIAGHLGL